MTNYNFSRSEADVSDIEAEQQDTSNVDGDDEDSVHSPIELYNESDVGQFEEESEAEFEHEFEGDEASVLFPSEEAGIFENTHDTEEDIAKKFMALCHTHQMSIAAQDSCWQFINDNCVHLSEIKDTTNLRCLKNIRNSLKKELPSCLLSARIINIENKKPRNIVDAKTLKYNLEKEAVTFHYGFVPIKEIIAFHKSLHQHWDANNAKVKIQKHLLHPS